MQRRIKIDKHPAEDFYVFFSPQIRSLNAREDVQHEGDVVGQQLVNLLQKRDTLPRQGLQLTACNQREQKVLCPEYGALAGVRIAMGKKLNENAEEAAAAVVAELRHAEEMLREAQIQAKPKRAPPTVTMNSAPVTLARPAALDRTAHQKYTYGKTGIRLDMSQTHLGKVARYPFKQDLIRHEATLRAARNNWG